MYHDQTGAIDFHEAIDPAVSPTHPTFERYQDALLDYTKALEELTGTDQDPVLYRGRPDIIIEIYDTRGPEDDLVSVVIGEVKFSASAQTFREGLQELVTYRRFAEYDDGYLVNDPTVAVTSLLITNGYSTAGTAKDIFHQNRDALLSGDAALPIPIAIDETTLLQ